MTLHRTSSTWRQLLAAGTLLAAAVGAQASVVSVFDLRPGAGGWRTTEDNSLFQIWRTGSLNATDGVAATPFYSNSATGLDPASMMWNCGADGSLCPAGTALHRGEAGLGPTEAYFGRSIFVQPGSTATGFVSILADDFFHLWVNGVSVVDGLLDQQSTPHVRDLTPYLRDGDNVLAIRALDGHLEAGQTTSCAQRAVGDPTGGWGLVNTTLGLFCKGNRGNEYVAIAGSITTVPEPTSLALVGVALFLTAGVSRLQAGRTRV